LVGGPPGIELHTVVEELPTEGVGDTLPVVVIGVGMVPNADAGIIAVGDIAVVAGVIVAVLPGMGVETVPATVDDVGTGTGVIEGDGRAGIASGCGAGMVEPGKSDMNDVAGCADSVSIGVAALPVAGVEEVAADVVGAADIDGVIPFVAAIDDREVTGTV
jgi:hypothetical protein